jgi:hypothetical protein
VVAARLETLRFRRAASFFKETCMRPTLSLREPQDAPRVKEAKEIVAAALGGLDPTLVPWAMRMTEARDVWSNGKRKGS